MHESLILGLFLILLIVAGMVGVLRLLYSFLCAAPETGESEIQVVICLKGDVEAEPVLRAAKEIRDVYFPAAAIKVICEEDYKEKALAEKAACIYDIGFEESPKI